MCHYHVSRENVVLFRVRDESTQLQALRLVRRLLAQLSTDDILYVMDAVTSLVRCASVQCRGEAYDILMWIYDKYRCTSVFNHLYAAFKFIAQFYVHSDNYK